jgi:hypothetical protein
VLPPPEDEPTLLPLLPPPSEPLLPVSFFPAFRFTARHDSTYFPRLGLPPQQYMALTSALLFFLLCRGEVRKWLSPAWPSKTWLYKKSHNVATLSMDLLTSRARYRNKRESRIYGNRFLGYMPLAADARPAAAAKAENSPTATASYALETGDEDEPDDPPPPSPPPPLTLPSAPLLVTLMMVPLTEQLVSHRGFSMPSGNVHVSKSISSRAQLHRHGQATMTAQ